MGWVTLNTTLGRGHRDTKQGLGFLGFRCTYPERPSECMGIGVRSLGEHARLVLRNLKPQTPMQKREAEASQTEDMQVEDGGGFQG